MAGTLRRYQVGAEAAPHGMVCCEWSCRIQLDVGSPPVRYEDATRYMRRSWQSLVWISMGNEAFIFSTTVDCRRCVCLRGHRLLPGPCINFSRLFGTSASISNVRAFLQSLFHHRTHHEPLFPNRSSEVRRRKLNCNLAFT